MQYCVLRKFSLTLLSLNINLTIMGYDYLFYNDLPKGVKTVYVNGKRLSLKEFNEAKKKFLSKKGNRIES